MRPAFFRPIAILQVHALGGGVVASVGLAALTPDVCTAAEAPSATLAARGTKSFRQGDFARALTDFEEAVTLVERGQGDQALLPVLRFNLGRCLEELGRPREAIAAFERYLQTPDSETARARAHERIAALEMRHFARLLVECKPAPAQLTVNGRELGACGVVMTRLDPGMLSVEARNTDGLRARGTYALMAGVEMRATLTFGARIRVEAPEGDALEVRVDDASVSGPPYTAEVEAGPHRVDVRLPDGRDWHRDVRVSPGTTLALRPLGAEASAPSEPVGPAWRKPWPWVAFGGAVAAGGLSAYFLTEAQDNADVTASAVDAHNGTRDETTRARAKLVAENARADAENQIIAGYVSLGAGLLLAGLGAYLIWPRSDAGSAPQAEPSASLTLSPGAAIGTWRW